MKPHWRKKAMIDATENEYRVYMEYAHGYALIMDKFLEGITRRFRKQSMKQGAMALARSSLLT